MVHFYASLLWLLTFVYSVTHHYVFAQLHSKYRWVIVSDQCIVCY